MKKSGDTRSKVYYVISECFFVLMCATFVLAVLKYNGIYVQLAMVTTVVFCATFKVLYHIRKRRFVRKQKREIDEVKVKSESTFRAVTPFDVDRSAFKAKKAMDEYGDALIRSAGLEKLLEDEEKARLLNIDKRNLKDSTEEANRKKQKALDACEEFEKIKNDMEKRKEILSKFCNNLGDR